MKTDRANVICILDTLKEYSDAEHILPMRELIAKIELTYGIKPDRRTVYSAVELLIELGYDISAYEENGIGYYLRSREFEPAEICLLADAVYSFPFIPAGQSEQLVRKLQKQLPVQRRKQHRHLTVVKADAKTDNRQVFWIIDQLDEAISRRCKVSFTYLKRDIDKKLVPRREAPYTVSPYRLLFANDHYYLACGQDAHSQMSMYRVDRMSNITLLPDEPIVGKMEETEITHAVYAFAGEPQYIVLRCKQNFLDEIIDRFGSAIHVKKEPDGMITVGVNAAHEGVKYWALQYLPYIEVTEPKRLRDEIIECIKGNLYTKEG